MLGSLRCEDLSTDTLDIFIFSVNLFIQISDGLAYIIICGSRHAGILALVIIHLAKFCELCLDLIF